MGMHACIYPAGNSVPHYCAQQAVRNAAGQRRWQEGTWPLQNVTGWEQRQKAARCHCQPDDNSSSQGPLRQKKVGQCRHKRCRQSRRSSSSSELTSGAVVQVGQERLAQLQTILLCSERGLLKMARRYPRLLQMEPAEVLQRLLRLKAELPRCNVAQMVEVQPLLFLGQSTEDVAAQVSTNYRLLARELPGVDVDTVVSERPAVLFIDASKWPAGLAQIREMTSFPTDTATLSNLLWALFGRSLEDRWDQVL